MASLIGAADTGSTVVLRGSCLLGTDLLQRYMPSLLHRLGARHVRHRQRSRRGKFGGANEGELQVSVGLEGCAVHSDSTILGPARVSFDSRKRREPENDQYGVEVM